MQTVTLRFRLTSRESAHEFDHDQYAIELSAVGFDTASSTFRIDLAEDSRLRGVETRIANNRNTKEDLLDVGVNLFAGLLGGEVRERFESIAEQYAKEDDVVFHVRLTLPAELQDLSWEALYDDRLAFLAENDRFAVIRDPPHDTPPKIWERAGGSLSVLVAIPTGSNLHVEHEMTNLRREVEPLGRAVRLVQLDGQVTPASLAEKLESEPWDVFHFVGHGRLNNHGDALIRLNSEGDGDHWLEAEQLGAIFRRSPVQLAVLNSCLGAQPDPSRSLSGLGPYLMRAGVASVVAMRYEINDRDALRFSRSFYKELFNPEHPGRIDLAVERARYDLFLCSSAKNVRAFITPVLYLAPGCECLENLPLAETEIATARTTVAAGPAVSDEVPADLITAVKEGQCVPIVGPGLLNAGADRSNGDPPAPLALAGRVVELEDYECPLREELGRVETLDQWMALETLQRVCEHYVYSMPSTYGLTRTLQDAYKNVPIPAEMQTLASWRLPGLVCTYFDGLMARSFNEIQKPVRVLNRVDDEAGAGNDMALLVNLRGSIADENSLVLTEHMNEEAANRMARMSRHVKDLVHKGSGRVLLFLGVSPRDALVRRYLAELLPRNRLRYLNLAGVYFVEHHHSAADEAYWSQFKVVWIDESPDRVIQGITSATREH